MESPKKSRFQFTNPRIIKLIFEENSTFDSAKYNGLGSTISTNVDNQNTNSADVELRLCLGVEKETVPFSLDITVKAGFKWDESMDIDLANVLLNKNAKVLLLSYLRPFVTHLIVDAGYPPLVLPFYDFSED
jgi:preprotein translocase subunit SecB